MAETLALRAVADDLVVPAWLERFPGSLSAVAPASQVLLSGDPGDAAFRAAAEAALGFALPGPAGRAGEAVHATWQAPDRWLVVAEQEAGLAARVAAACAGTVTLVSDVTQGLAVFEVAGPHARALLAQAVTLDLAPGAFAPGQGAATPFAGLPVTLYPLAAERLRLHGERASARFLWEWLTTAASAYARA
mgnify:CR=1 FL=1